MNLTMLLEMAADGFGDRVLIGGASDGISATKWRAQAKGGAAVVRARRAGAIVYLTTNGPAFPVAMFAAAYADVPLVPLNYRLGEEQLDFLLEKHPDALVIAGERSHQIASRRGLHVLDPEEWLELAEEAGRVDEDIDSDDPSSPAVVIYTSGTTSQPKGVLLQHDNLVSYVLGSVEFMGAEPDEAAIVCLPPYHIAAVANTISNLYAGRRTLVLEQFTPDQWIATVRAEGITNALVVPTMLSRLVQHDTDQDVPSLRNLAYGGAPMPAKIIEEAMRMWPDVGFVNAYGLTETSSTVAVLGPEDHRAALASDLPEVRARLGSAGRAIPSVEISIKDALDRDLGPGEVGRILVRGEQVSAEYAGVGKATDDDGWFDTRDKGYLDDEGYLFIGGRVDDTIIRGGENIAPAEIEVVLLGHPAVADCCVVGLPDEEWGQRLEAAVVIKVDTSVDVEDLRAFVRAQLRSSKTPDRIHPVTELPRTETGKLVRRHVVDMLAKELTTGA